MDSQTPNTKSQVASDLQIEMKMKALSLIFSAISVLPTFEAVSLRNNVHVGAEELTALKDVSANSVKSDPCSGDEYSMEYAAQRGCRSIGGDSATVCCGSCNREVCKTRMCMGCKVNEDIDVEDLLDQIKVQLPDDGPPGTLVFPVGDPLKVLHGLIDLGLNSIEGGAVFAFVVDMLWPEFHENVWLQVKSYVESYIENIELGEVENILDVINNLMKRAKTDPNFLESAYVTVVTNLQIIVNKLTSGKEGISLEAGYPLAVAASIMLFTFERSIIDHFTATGNQLSATTLKSLFESDVMKYTTLLASNLNLYSILYKDKNYVERKFQRYGPMPVNFVSIEYPAANLKYEMFDFAYKDGISDFLQRLMFSHSLRMLSPISLVARIVDKTLPAVQPVVDGVGDELTFMYAGEVFPGMTKGKSVGKENDPVILSKVNTIEAKVDKYIEGLAIGQTISGADCVKGRCWTYSMPGDLLSVYLKMDNDHLISMILHFENAQTFIDGTDAPSDTFVFQSPYARLSSDRFKISMLQTGVDAGQIGFYFSWDGEKISESDLNQLPNYGSYSDPDFKDFLHKMFLRSNQLKEYPQPLLHPIFP